MQCDATTSKGARCKLPAATGSHLCAVHIGGNHFVWVETAPTTPPSPSRLRRLRALLRLP